MGKISNCFYTSNACRKRLRFCSDFKSKENPSRLRETKIPSSRIRSDPSKIRDIKRFDILDRIGHDFHESIPIQVVCEGLGFCADLPANRKSVFGHTPDLKIAHHCFKDGMRD